MHVIKEVGLISLLLLGACRQPVETAAPAPERPPIILISVDTLRSDRLPAYGYTRVETPHLDALRRDGVLHERAYSHVPMTLPSHASMFTGLLPTEHGVRNNIGYPFEPEKLRTLAETLRENGYRTGAAVSSYVLRSETGIGDGFEVYDDAIAIVSGGATSEHQRSGFETVQKAEAFVASHASEPFFLFVHLYEPHAPYTPPEPFRSRYRDPYDGEIAASDAIVGKLIASLKAKGIYDRAAIVFTSDHGEALWEHGEDQHGILLYREALQVPLIIKLPRSERANSSVSTPFALRQLYDEILRLAGVGSDATPDAKPPQPIYSETLYPRIHLGWSELRSLIDGNYHYIESSSPELYDLSKDPGETKNLIADERRVAASMRNALAQVPAGDTAIAAIDPEEAAKLAALGYIGTPQNREGPLPNPREEIHTLREIKAAFQLAADRQYDEAAKALRALLEKNPGLTDVASRLGEVLRDSGRDAEAIEVYRAALARSQRVAPELAIALAVTYLKTEKPREATAHALLALRTHPVEAREVLARAAIAEQRFAEAETHARAAIEASERAPKSLLVLAELQRATGQLEAALVTLDQAEARATELGTKQPGIDHLRADVLARLDKPEEAITAYRREIARFPRQIQSYANLAVVYLALGDRREAERVLRAMTKANPHEGARALAEKTRAVSSP
ncbi:MAG TPA: sulfatase-like hydrolase/transferase [Thermoanaerobaculia bacterium]|jgi:arylsulfatase A-like enzyme/Flp pilus assembly protein TadD